MGTRSRFSSTTSRAGFVGALLVGALILSGVLAYQAVDAGRSHEEVALKAVKEQALFAAWEFSGTARRYVDDKLLKPGLEAVFRLGGKPGKELVHPATDPHADFGKWSYADSLAGAFFRVDLRTGEAVFAGLPDPDLEAWVKRGLLQHLALDLGERWDPVLVQPGDGKGLIVYRTLPEGEPVPETAYGLRLRPGSLSIPLGYAFTGPSLLPEALTRGRANGELFSVVLSTADGRPIWRSGERYRSPFVATDTMGARFAGLTTSVTVNPAVAESLTIGGFPRSRLPLVMGLLLLTVGLVAGALFQLRREAELSQLRADFVSGVSHELRTPLAQIRMFAETLLLGRVRSDEERLRSLEIIANESQRLTHQVENILLYSRAERKTLRVQKEAVDVGRLVLDVTEAFAPLADKARARVDVTSEDGLVGDVDGALVRQALINLLDNAVKYGPAGQHIQVASERDPAGRIRIRVEDEGPGIPARDRQRIFEPYFRLAAHRESAVAGSGIGLSVVRQVVRAIGGDVRVEDAGRGNGAGGGARFVLTLPPARSGAGVGDGRPLRGATLARSGD